MTPARARVLQLFADRLMRAKGDAAREAGVSAGVHRRADRRGHAGDGGAAAGAGDAAARCGFPQARILARPARRRRRAAHHRRSGRLHGDAARRRHRLRQNRSLFRGGGGKYPAQAADADPDAGDRAHRAVARPLHRALRHAGRRNGIRNLSPRTRARTWGAVAANEVSVVVGARSALFLPYADLGLIVVDEEHDPAYKQEDGAHYHARDMAVVRGSVAKIPVVLASATPSVESEVNARRGRYKRIHLPERFGGAHLPMIEAIDMRREGPPRGRFIAPRLAEAVQIALERREQALLFLNRRGYAPLTLVPRLRLPPAMPELRRLAGRSPLQAAAGLPPLRLLHAAAGGMPELPRHRKLRAVGPGVERLEQEAAELFPGRPHPGAVERSGGIDGAPAPGARRRGARPLRHRHRHAAGRQGPSFSQAQSGRHRRRRSRASATAIRARPSARSNCCIRWSAAPAARRGAASASCRRTSPSIR